MAGWGKRKLNSVTIRTFSDGKTTIFGKVGSGANTTTVILVNKKMPDKEAKRLYSHYRSLIGSYMSDVPRER